MRDRDAGTDRPVQVRLVKAFGEENGITDEVSPAGLDLGMHPDLVAAADEFLMLAALQGDFTYRSDPGRNRFLIEVGQYSDLCCLGEALAEIAALGSEMLPGSAVDDLVRGLRRLRDEEIAAMETAVIENEIMTDASGGAWR